MSIYNYFKSIFIILINMALFYIFKEEYILLKTKFNVDEKFLLNANLSLIPCVNIVLGFIFYNLSKKLTVNQIVIKTYTSILCLLLLFSFILLPNSSSLSPSFSETSFTLQLLNKWIFSIYFIVYSFWSPISLLMFYGFMNERITLKEAAKFYPIYGIIAIFFSQIVLQKVVPIQYELIQPLFANGSIYLCSILLGLNIYLFKSLDKSINLRKSTEHLKYKISLLLKIMIVFLIISIDFTKYISMHFSRENPLDIALNYMQSIESFSSLKAVATFITILVLAFISVYIQQNKVKGWKHIFFISAAISTTVAIIMISLCMFKQFIAIDNSELYKRFIGLSLNYQILTNVVLYPTFLFLIQLIYVALPKPHQFKIQIITCLLLNKIGFFLTVGFQNRLAFLKETWGTTICWHLFVVFILISIVRLFSIYYIGKKLEHAPVT